MTSNPMNSRITRIPTAALVVATAFLAACGDSSLETGARSTSARGVSLSRFDGSYSFTYDPARGITTKLSDKYHTISIPAYGVCDPAVSTYGPGEWDEPCTTLTHPITISVKSYSDEDGSNPYLDFEPALRFVPSKATILTFNMKKATVAEGSTINYCVTADMCVNEGLADPSLATFYDGKGKMSRRIKHFSGYNVAAGIECVPTSGDPDCIDIGDELRTSRGVLSGMTFTGAASSGNAVERRQGRRRSGYMVVSGLENR